MSAPQAAQDILAELSPERQDVMERLLDVLRTHLPEGFEETISYGMIGFVVPLSTYPAGYHAKKGEPLPFMSLASQKNHVALYHMGVELFPDVLDWFRGGVWPADDNEARHGEGLHPVSESENDPL